MLKVNKMLKTKSKAKKILNLKKTKAYKRGGAT
jgi:hypothetical protein